MPKGSDTVEPTENIIAVPLKGFMQWGGGVDFIRLILEALLHDPTSKVVVLVPRPTRGQRFRKAIGQYLRHARSFFQGADTPEALNSYKPEEVILAIADFLPRISVNFYPDCTTGLRKTIYRIRATMLIPCFEPMDQREQVPWVGYLYDFQHRYLEDFFSKNERKTRDIQFTRMIEQAPIVICNSDAVRRDTERFFPGKEEKVISLPLTPIPKTEWFDTDPAAIRIKFDLKQRYFIVCNQFWLHKDHKTAIRAFAEYLARSGDPDVELVCTGNLGDYRSPQYAKNLLELIDQLHLRSKVRLLGHIPKLEQIALLRGAIALLQPTLFEGGRGGGAVVEAIALGVHSLVSDIPVNLEITSPICHFFTAGSPSSLANLMIESTTWTPSYATKESLMAPSKPLIAELSKCLESAMQRAKTANALRNKAS